MNLGKWFAYAQMVLSLGAAAGYAIALDFRHCVYWIAAAVLTACVTL